MHSKHSVKPVPASLQIQRGSKRLVPVLRVSGALSPEQADQAAPALYEDPIEVRIRVLHSVHPECALWKPQHPPSAAA
jgi:hypothetical protein